MNMSTHPLLIDNVAFAKQNERLEADLSLQHFSRLAELLQSIARIDVAKSPSDQANLDYSQTAVHYVLHGETDAVGQHYLHLSISTDLSTVCQRCMGNMPLKLNLNFNYLIGDVNVDDVEASDTEGSDDLDLQQASPAMDIIALIEDEIIMAMPIAPIHDNDCGAIISQSGDKANPFAVLKGLIKP
jgi:uncharacterized protein